jgi:hypothetical protein
MKLNDNERIVLTVLAQYANDEFGYFSFAGLANHLKDDHGIALDRKAIRRACRSLARKGLAEYGRGLWCDDGTPAGSGYGITRSGISFMKEAA